MRTNGIIKNNTNVLKKRRNTQNALERKLLEKNFKIWKAFISSGMHSKSETHFKSEKCLNHIEIIKLPSPFPYATCSPL